MVNTVKRLGIGGMVAFVLAYILAGNAVKGLFRRSTPDVRSKAFLSQVANELNKTAPKMIDKDTELTSAVGLVAFLFTTTVC